MRLILDIVIFMVVAVSLGIGSAYVAVNNADRLERFEVGPWQAWPKASSPEVNPYSKADQARRGSLPLGSGEGIAFIAQSDDEGTPLDGACQYSVTGSDLPARVWTLTLVSESGALVENPSFRHGYHSRNIALVDGSKFEIVTGPEAIGGNWLRSDPLSRFHLVLRLYETRLASGGGVTDIALPKISWMSCQ